MNSKKRILIWFIMLIGGIVVAVYSDLKFFRNIFLSWQFHAASFVLGILLMRLVFRVARNTGRTLAKYGRKGNVEKLNTNVLVTRGPYAYMRHPMHLALLFMPLGWGLIFGSPTFILIIWPVEVIFMLLMIKWVEEPEARAKFGPDYDRYAGKLPWFCFKPECLKALLKNVPKN